MAGPAITTTDASAGTFSSRTRLRSCDLVAVLCQSALRNLVTCTISAVDSLLAVTLDKVDSLFLALDEFHQGVRDVFLGRRRSCFSMRSTLLFPASRMMVPNFCSLTRHRIGELFVHRDLVLLRRLRILVGIDELHLDPSILMRIEVQQL